MDFSQSYLSNLISNNQTDEKAKYSNAIRKIDAIASVITKVFGKAHFKKLVETDYRTLKFTSSPSIIFDNVTITHPLVQLLIEYVQKLDVLGDSSKFFIILIKHLLADSFKIVERGVKPAKVSELFRGLASEIEEISLEFVEDYKFDFESEESICRILMGLIKNKKVCEMVAKAVINTKSFNSENLRICKIPCGSIDDSVLVEGMVFNRAPEGSVKSVENASTSIYNAPLDINRTELKGVIMMNKADELLNFSKKEVEYIKSTVDKLDSDVIITSGKVDNVYLDFLNNKNRLVFKIVSKHDIRRIRNLLGGEITQSVEKHSDAEKGRAKEVSTFLVGDKLYTKFIGYTHKVYTLILKDSLEIVLDEHEREILKALKAMNKNSCEGKIKLVPGSGRFERKLVNKLLSKINDDTEDDIYKGYVYECLSRSLENFEESDSEIVDIYNAKIKAIKYALDFVAIMYETDSYLIGKRDMLDIKPKMNEHWDDDDH